ncbi:MAG: nitrate- and nitrite sensing domain-containing protein [Sandaracinaceae bacterium]
MRTKLLLLVAPATVAFFVLGTSSVARNVHQRSESAELRGSVELAIGVSALVHELQKERGATSLFLASQGQRFARELEAQRAQTDRVHEELEAYLDASTVPQGSVASTVQALRNDIRALPAMRTRVDGLQVERSRATSYYTGLNARGLALVGSIAQTTREPELMRCSAALVALSSAKEHAGQERSVISSTLAQGAFGEGERDRLVHLVATQSAFINRFHGWADEAEAAAYDSAMEGPGASAEATRTRVLASPPDRVEGTPEAWFELQTAKINALRAVEMTVAESALTRRHRTPQQRKRAGHGVGRWACARLHRHRVPVVARRKGHHNLTQTAFDGRRRSRRG